ncbi:hypothetical protein PR048_007853 [Dryococelus australis]|uniref:Uncharacterized protein n=1 Tax=Dryococelus australis TaxID=614101 RepID=A0ABQ9HVF3_9NEOP|nr:hypothetical protein PR048_007853 [Dryococelus australis]
MPRGRGGLADSLLASHQGEPGSIPSWITPGFFFACGNRAGRCRWSAGFLGDLPFPPPPPPFHFGAAPCSTQSPSSALKTSLLRAAQISSLTLLPGLTHSPFHCLCAQGDQLVGSLSVGDWFGRGFMGSEPTRAKRGKAIMEQCRNVRAGETGDPRENPLTSGHRPDRFTRTKIREWLHPTGIRTRFALEGGNDKQGGLPHRGPIEAVEVVTSDCSRRLDMAFLVGGNLRGGGNGMRGRGKREVPEKTYRPAASSYTFRKSENPCVTAGNRTRFALPTILGFLSGLLNTTADLPWRSRLVNDRSGLREALVTRLTERSGKLGNALDSGGPGFDYRSESDLISVLRVTVKHSKRHVTRPRINKYGMQWCGGRENPEKTPSFKLRKSGHTVRERAISVEFTCSEYWDMAMAMGASSGQDPCILHASNVRRKLYWEHPDNYPQSTQTHGSLYPRCR